MNELNNFGKLPPQCIDIEQAILGTFLLERESWEFIRLVRDEMFYKESNKIIFESIVTLYNEKKPIDMLTITEDLKSNGKLEEVGGAVYLAELTKNISSAQHLDYHIHIFIQKYLQRVIISKSNDIMNDAYDDDCELDDLVGKIEQMFKSVLDEVDQDMTVFKFYDTVFQSRQLAEQRMIDLERGKLPGIHIPIGVLQDMIGGWQKGDLIYIAARPSMGKTAVAAHFAKFASKRGFKTVFFSLEMSKIALTDRMVLGETGIEPDRWRNGELSYSDFDLIDKKHVELSGWPLFINDKPSIRPEDVEMVCKRIRPDIIFLDYIQLMRSPRGRKYDNRNLELGEISHRLKAIAKEYEIPVICCSQLNRNIDSRGNKIPTLSDLRDSGELEQDADLIIFPYRPFVHTRDPNDIGKIEFYIAKHRNGKVGMAAARHNEFINDFYDLENI